MAKYPAAGSVKTRLAARIGPEAAARLHEAFIRDLAARLPALGLPLTWAFWPPDAPFAGLVAGQRCVPQAGRDLGERLVHAVAGCFATRALPVVTIGADSPHLELACLSAAAAALAEDADVVLGPATDGGYYLIGLRAPEPAVFRDIAWSSRHVLEQTLARAREAGLRTRLLAPTFDVDDEEGLRTLCALLESGSVALPYTLAALPDAYRPVR